MNIQLETERILLRPFKMGDEAGVFEFGSNPEVQKYTGSPNLDSLEGAIALIQHVWLKDYARYGYGRFAVIHKADNKIIGFCGVKYISELKQTDLAYRFLPEYWNKGIATESSKLILAYAFNTLKLKELIAFVADKNPASSAVLKKLGFSYFESKPCPGDTEDSLFYSLAHSHYKNQ